MWLAVMSLPGKREHADGLVVCELMNWDTNYEVNCHQHAGMAIQRYLPSATGLLRFLPLSPSVPPRPSSQKQTCRLGIGLQAVTARPGMPPAD